MSISNEETALSRTQQVFVYKRLEVIVSVDYQTLIVQKVSDQHVSQPLINLDLGMTRPRSFQQKPADKGNPQTPDAGAGKEPKHPHHYESKGDDLTDTRCQPSGTHVVTGKPPQDRSQHAAAVQGKARDKIKNRQRNIDVAQPHKHCRGRRARIGSGGPAEYPGNGKTANPNQQAHDRAGYSHPKLSGGVIGLFFDLSDTTKSKQGDSPHW